MAEKSLDPESGRGPKHLSFPHWRLIFDQAPISPEIQEWPYEGSGTDTDPYIICWISHDPRDPKTFSKWRKWVLTILVTFMTLTTAFGSSTYAGSIDQTVEDLHVSEEVATLGLALYVLGFVPGTLFWAPLSESNGRQLIFFWSYALFTIFNIAGTVAPNIQSLLVFRFLAGTLGSSPYTNSGGVIADIFPASERGIPMTFFGTAPFLGPVLGPVVGGFLGETKGWRWVQGVFTILAGVLWILSTFLIPETYAPYLLHKRAEKLSKITGKVYRTSIEVDQGKTPTIQLLKAALLRPWILLLKEPIVLFLSIWMSISYGTLYLLFAAYPIVYQARGWNEGLSNLPFLGITIGMVAAIFYNVFDNRRYHGLVCKLGGGGLPPEARLPSAMVGGVVLPIGLFWFAWTNSPSVPWPASVAAGIPFGFGMVLTFVAIKSYLVDAYTIFAASALAATVVLRSFFGAGFPMFTTYMYHNLGVHWASSITAFLALMCTPLPFVFYKYGAQIRLRCKYAAQAAAAMKKLRGEGESEDEMDKGLRKKGDEEDQQ
ncbi:MAG: hypothetical protein M1834_001955 [Cirrosporium novae-zelandiae]|nr:MAG: hypothetical protein M1834_001955 [Cirrosporium novae-zelandiae]